MSETLPSFDQPTRSSPLHPASLNGNSLINDGKSAKRRMVLAKLVKARELDNQSDPTVADRIDSFSRDCGASLDLEDAFVQHEHAPVNIPGYAESPSPSLPSLPPSLYVNMALQEHSSHGCEETSVGGTPLGSRNDVFPVTPPSIHPGRKLPPIRDKRRQNSQNNSPSMSDVDTCSIGSVQGEERAPAGGIRCSTQRHIRPSSARLRHARSTEAISTGCDPADDIRHVPPAAVFNPNVSSASSSLSNELAQSRESSGSTSFGARAGSDYGYAASDTAIYTGPMRSNIAGQHGQSQLSPARRLRMIASTACLTTGLQKITVEEARQTRDGYLMGKGGCTHWVSLLGPKELSRNFPDHRARIFCGTWNVAGQKIGDEHLEEWLLPRKCEHIPDIYAIGIQEGPVLQRSWTEWEVLVQTVIGPSHVLYHSAYLGVQHLAIFVRRELVWFLSIPSDDACSTRAVSSIRTKGAVAVAFYIFGTSLIFVSSHLAAHEFNVVKRCEHYFAIVDGLKFPRYQREERVLPGSGGRRRDVTDSFDVAFWMGDLNFRIQKERQAVVDTVATIQKFAVDDDGAESLHSHYEDILQDDELIGIMRDGVAFHGFSEGCIRFPPTYKYDIGTTTYNNIGKLRVPSYTDRVLYKTKEGDVQLEHYHAVPEICSSDHKPVYAVFNIHVRPGRDIIPPSGGKFKRGIYVQGLSPKSLARSRRSRSKSKRRQPGGESPQRLDAEESRSSSLSSLVTAGEPATNSTERQSSTRICSIQ